MLNFFTAQNYLYAKLPAIATNGDFWAKICGLEMWKFFAYLH